MTPMRAPVPSSDKKWIDEPSLCVYTSPDGELFGQISKTRDGWDAFDMQILNAAQTGPFCIGHYHDTEDPEKAKAAAKQAVEDHWSMIL